MYSDRLLFAAALLLCTACNGTSGPPSSLPSPPASSGGEDSEAVADRERRFQLARTWAGGERTLEAQDMVGDLLLEDSAGFRAGRVRSVRGDVGLPGHLERIELYATARVKPVALELHGATLGPRAKGRFWLGLATLKLVPSRHMWAATTFEVLRAGKVVRAEKPSPVRLVDERQRFRPLRRTLTRHARRRVVLMINQMT